MNPDMSAVFIVFVWMFLLMMVIFFTAIVLYLWNLFIPINQPRSSMRKAKKLKCSIILATIFMTLAVFLGNLGHSEYLSQQAKSKKIYQTKKISLLHLDDTITTTTDIEYK